MKKILRPRYELVQAEVDAKVCPVCDAVDVKAAHFKSIGKKRLKAGEVENPCHGYKSEKRRVPGHVWGQREEFKISPTAMLRYQGVKGHKPVYHPKERDADGNRKVTFDSTAIRTLEARHPEDKLYKELADFSKRRKLIGTYIGRTQPDGTIKGGIPVGRDGLVHTLFCHNPSTLRLSSQNPNLQNLPRPNAKDPNDISNLIRGFFVPHPGNILIASDFSGIEAVLVGYEAEDPGYIRLARRDVHSFYTAWAIHSLDPQRLSANDLPELGWDDEKLFGRLAEIKKEFKWDRNTVYKHLVHACLTPGHEVLTPYGWVSIENWQGEEVAQWDQGSVEFVAPQRFVEEDHSGSVIDLYGRGVSATMTPDHKVPVENTYGTLKQKVASELLEQKDWRLPVSGVLETAGQFSESMVRLAVAIQADGHISPQGAVRFHLVKQRKRERLTHILNALGIDYKVSKCLDHEDGEHFWFKWDVGVGYYLDRDRKEFYLGRLLSSPTGVREVFLEEVLKWDGHQPATTCGRQAAYVSTNYHNATVVQTIAHLLGKSSTVREVSQRGNRRPLWKASLSNRKFVRLNSATTSVNMEQYSGKVYCFTVPSGWFLVRHRGRISATGNCNFGQKEKGARDKIYKETGINHELRLLRQLMGLYREELFPSIPAWQERITERADKDGFLRNAFGYRHYFPAVRERKYTGVTIDGEKIWNSRPGPDASKVFAFGPQSNAAAIIKEAILRLFFERFEEAGRYLRLQIHDEIWGECPIPERERVVSIFEEEMGKPIPELAMPEHWGLGEHLSIVVESKWGERWSVMGD